MGKRLQIFVVMVMLLVACRPAADATTTSRKLPATTTTSVAKGGPSTTSAAQPAPSSTTGGNLSADDATQLDEAKSHMGQPELADSGKLSETGAPDASAADQNPFTDLGIFFFEDQDGNLVFYVEGPPELVRGITVEFDAINETFNVVAEGGYVGDQLAGPGASWSLEPQTTNGQVLQAADNPPPPVTDGDRLGAFIPTPITTLDEFTEVSIWIYSGLDEGRFDYAHYRLLLEMLIEQTDDSIIAAAFFAGILTPEGINPYIVWTTPGD